MTLTDDAAAILARIRETPECDTLRLVFADRLEETDVPAMVAWAEFVRLQCELAEMVPCVPWCSGDCKRKEYERRERDLWPAVRPIFEGTGWQVLVDHEPFGTGPEDLVGPVLTVRRGLPAVVRTTLEAWRGGRITESVYGYRPEYDPGIGPRLVAAWPVELVEITDRAPQRFRYTSEQVDVFGWSKTRNGDPFNLPAEVFDALTKGVEKAGSMWRDYPSIEMARDAMSKVLLLEARSPAEVPT